MCLKHKIKGGRKIKDKEDREMNEDKKGMKKKNQIKEGEKEACVYEVGFLV